VDLAIRALCRRAPDSRDKIEIVVIETPGDRDRVSYLEKLGGRGVFTDCLDAAIAAGKIDYAVHAMKDMAPCLREPVVIGAVLERTDPREVLVAPGFANLAAIPKGAVFGSSSIRRRAFLRRLRPDLRFDLLRGNVEERVAQVHGPNYDGTILAFAGLARLGLHKEIAQTFSLDLLPPDPAQGAIGITCHRENFIGRRLLQSINHSLSAIEVTTERALLKNLPEPDAFAIGAIARAHNGRVCLSAALVSEDGAYHWSYSDESTLDHAEALGRRVGMALRKPALNLVYA